MAKQLAQHIGYIYVDSGAMYRAVTLFALRNSIFSKENQIDTARLEQLMPQVKVSFRINPETKLPETMLGDECVEQQIRTIEVSNHVSLIAALPFVRTAMTSQQQEMGKAKGIVMDGRDIGTAVFPDAELKIFVTARAEVRARRRYEELDAKGMSTSYDEILKNVEERDYIDSHREVSPLRQAEDALVLDNSDLTRQQQLYWLIAHFNKRIFDL